MSLNTYEGKAKNLPVTFIQNEFTAWQFPNDYYSPVYNNKETLTRTPDFRVQLFWDPIITILPGGKYEGEFYTSNVDGDFLIEVLGVNSNGENINLRQKIEVKR